MSDNEAYFKQAVQSEKEGQVDLAATLYQHILDELPSHPATLYNLGTLNAKRNRYQQAIDLFERLLQVAPGAVNAYYNAAICYVKLGDIPNAVAHLEKAVQLVPHYEEAQHLLGGILLRQEKFEQAEIHLQEALRATPDNAHAQCHMGMLYSHTSRMDKAKSHLEKAIALDSTLPEAYYHLGLIALRRAQFDEADLHFQSTVARDPSHFSAYYNLALLKKQQKQYKLAQHYIERAHALSPEHPFVSYLYAMLDQTNGMIQTPAECVESLFDHYADYYDEHMTTVLHSDLPTQCLALFQQHHAGRVRLALDIGCGTGLCGSAFRSITDTLIGADLSEKMIEKAREKKIYDELYHENMFDTLKRFEHNVDLLLCCDTLVYVGALEPFFEGLKHALRPEGYALFSCEAGDEETFTLSLDGRFRHSELYLRACAQTYGFDMIGLEKVRLRDQEGSVVQGYVCLIK